MLDADYVVAIRADNSPTIACDRQHSPAEFDEGQQDRVAILRLALILVPLGSKLCL
jgi:hypothetical protein